MKDDNKPSRWFCSTPSGKDDHFYNMFMDAEKRKEPVWVGIDWAAGNGMIRGEVIKREGNVIYVRFNTVTV